MRNLKKVLALVLTLALALSMFAGAFPSYVYTETAATELAELNDAELEAFGVLYALGVVVGKGDAIGFEDILNRAELITLIYRVKTGDTGANGGAMYSGTNLSKYYTDGASVAAWAVPYVAWGYATRSMVGYGDGTVQYSRNVTGTEAAKMMLVALGYNPTIEGLEGPSWEANTIRLASSVGLLKNVSGTLSDVMRRADAFIMLKNALYSYMVQYVGGEATYKTDTLNSTKKVTLAEEGFSLLDITAVLVATDKVGMGAYWRNAVEDASNIVAAEDKTIVYKQYNTADTNEARFVYRDYVNAANVQALYTPKAVTVKLPTYEDVELGTTQMVASFHDLGNQYRLLITKPTGIYNADEVRTMYGFPIESAGDSQYVKTETTADNASIATWITDMAKRYATVVLGYNLNTTKWDDVKATALAGKDYTIFVNGAAATFAEAQAAVAGTTYSSAYVKAVDNDNDGVKDHLFISKYTIGVVNKVDDTNYYIVGNGMGTIAKSKVCALEGELAAGDYVAAYSNANEVAPWHIKELTVAEMSVSGFEPVSGGVESKQKYKLSDGNVYYKSTLMDEDDNSLMGTGAAAVTPTVLQFVTDGKYIYDVKATTNTKYEQYAIVTSITAPSTSLGYYQVRLYTEDNKYVYAYINTVNGIQPYYYQNNFSMFNLPETDALVSYTMSSENYVDLIVVANKTEAGSMFLPSATSLNTAFNSTKVTLDYDFIFDRTISNNSDSWAGLKTNAAGVYEDSASFVNSNGVVFVTYGKYDYTVMPTDMSYGPTYPTNDRYNAPFTYRYKAYFPGEFEPSYLNPYEAKTRSNVEGLSDAVAFAEVNGQKTIKAARISFDYGYTEYVLPGLPNTRTGEVIATIKSVSYEIVDGKYVYTFTTFDPWATTTTAYTTIPTSQLVMPAIGSVYKFDLNADGKVELFTPMISLTANSAFGTDADGYVLGSDGIEINRYLASSFYVSPYGEVTMTAKDLKVAVDDHMNDRVAVVETINLQVPSTANVWFLSGEGASIGTKDWMSFQGYNWNYLTNTDAAPYLVYVDYNPTTMAVRNMWILTSTAKASTFVWDFELDAEYEYDVNTKTFTYTFEDDTYDSEGWPYSYGDELHVLNGNGKSPDLASLYTNGIYSLAADSATRVALPYTDAYPTDGDVMVQFKLNATDLAAGVIDWDVSNVYEDEFYVTLYSNTLPTDANVDKQVSGIQYFQFDDTQFYVYLHNNANEIVAGGFNDMLRGGMMNTFWYRLGNGRLDWTTSSGNNYDQIDITNQITFNSSNPYKTGTNGILGNIYIPGISTYTNPVNPVTDVATKQYIVFEQATTVLGTVAQTTKAYTFEGVYVVKDSATGVIHNMVFVNNSPVAGANEYDIFPYSARTKAATAPGVPN